MFYQLKEGFPFVVMDLKFIIISGYKTRTFSDTTLNLMLLWSMVEIIIKINCNDKQPNNSYHSRESGCRTKQHYIKQHYIKQKAKSSKGSKRSQWKKKNCWKLRWNGTAPWEYASATRNKLLLLRSSSMSSPVPPCYSYAKMLQLSIKIIWNMNRE